jgi:hypothetical protein
MLSVNSFSTQLEATSKEDRDIDTLYEGTEKDEIK